jgi:Rho guanine nucleotide exchange factor 7
MFMERQGAAKPGLLVLTTGLSKPFRRLDKYSAILQELERHMEICHPDRGDTQRSIAVYKDLAASCSATRRQKELELQILTGPVRGWQGQELSSLGEIIHMGSVAVGPDHRDRYFVLFPQTLLILSVSQRMSAFKYEVSFGKFSCVLRHGSEIPKLIFFMDSTTNFKKKSHT